MAITAGAIASKISELRSRILIYETWVKTLQANYLPSDSGAPEIQMVRKDGATVTREHLEAAIQQIEEQIAAAANELDEWENLVFDDKPKEIEAPAALEDTRKEKNRGQAKRINPGAAASK